MPRGAEEDVEGERGEEDDRAGSTIGKAGGEGDRADDDEVEVVVAAAVVAMAEEEGEF